MGTGMGRSSNDDPTYRQSETPQISATSTAPHGSLQVTSAQPTVRMTSSSSALRLQHKSPQKQQVPSSQQLKHQQAQELLQDLHREEKIRDATSTMLAGIDFGLKHNNMIKQLNNSLNRDSNHKKKVRAQFDDSEEKIQKIKAQLLELGVVLDEDDEFSSGDEEQVNSTLFGEEYYQEDLHTLHTSISTNAFYQIAGSSSSMLDLTASKADISLDSKSKMKPETAFRHMFYIIENLTPHSQDGKLAVDLLERLITLVPLVKIELISTAPWQRVTGCIKPFLLERRVSKVALGLRLIKLLSVDATAFAYLRDSLLLDYYIVHILSRDYTHTENRMAVVQLIRAVVALQNGMSCISRGVRFALVSVAEQSRGSDDLRNLCVLTLAEMTALEPESVFEVGGLSVLIASITEPSDDSARHAKKSVKSGKGPTPLTLNTKVGNMENSSGQLTTPTSPTSPKHAPREEKSEMVSPKSSTITTSDLRLDLQTSSKIAHRGASFAVAMMMILVGAADRSDIRSKFFRRGKDLSLLLTPFTDVDLYLSYKSGRDFMIQSSTAMQVCLRSWVGVICFDLNLFVQCMTLPSKEIQETLLNVLDGVLWLPSSPQDHVSSNTTSANNSEKMLNQFTAILLHRLQLLGLQERLVRLQGNGLTERICHKAQKIGAKIFSLSAMLIPSHSVVKQSMALPKELEKTLAKAPPYSLPTASVALFGTEAELPSISTWSVSPSMQTFIRFGVNIDDFTFKKLILSTHVLDTKVFKQWNWDALMEIAQGPLRSPKRLEEVTRGSKFLKRLFAFYRPFKYRFSNLPITREHLRYVEVGKELMKSLLETQEGVRYLAQNKLFRQIAECLAQLDPLSGIVSDEPLLSVRRFKSTLCCAYAELIGVLSRSVVGQQILAQIRIFNMFYRVCEINREDVIRSVLCALDYRLEGHPRLILAKALTSHSRSVRLYATEFVGYRMATEEAHTWAIDLMVEQIYDVDIGVAQAAVAGLHNMCAASGQALEYTISLKPFLGHLKEAAEPLHILFMSRPTGFDILLAEFEHGDMNHWAPGFNEAFVDKIETYLEHVNTRNINSEEHSTAEPEYFVFPLYNRPSSRKLREPGGKILPPAHFYGELALTDQGCRFLQSKGSIDEIKNIVSQTAKNMHTNWSADKLRKIKGALWAIGHVASREKGGALFKLTDVENICDICRNAGTLSLRGTAYYVLGLFALSTSGAELLHQCNWDVVYDRYNQPVGVVLPPEIYYHYNEAMVFSESDDMDEDERKEETPRPQVKVVKAPDSNIQAKWRSRSSSLISTESQLPPTVEESEEDLFTDAEEYVSLPHRSQADISSHHAFDFELEKNTETQPDPVTNAAINDLLLAIGQLCGSVQASNAAKALVSMRAKHSHIFQSGIALRAVFELMSTGRYRQVIRRFILGLFDMPMCMEQLYHHN